MEDTLVITLLHHNLVIHSSNSYTIHRVLSFHSGHSSCFSPQHKELPFLTVEHVFHLSLLFFRDFIGVSGLVSPFSFSPETPSHSCSLSPHTHFFPSRSFRVYNSTSGIMFRARNDPLWDPPAISPSSILEVQKVRITLH